MIGIVGRRLLSVVPLLLAVSIIAFTLTSLLPGDPAASAAGADATPEQIEAMRQQLRLDDPPLTRYAAWLGSAVQGDLGTSSVTRLPILESIVERIPATASLALAALAFAVVLGLALGITQALFAGRWIDRALLMVSTVALSVPNFWLATLLIGFFAVQLGWFPAIGYVPITESFTGWLQTIILPAAALGFLLAGEISRQIRAGLLEVLDKDFVRALEARGLSRSRIIGRHALRAAGLPTLTIVGLRMGHLLAGSVIIEAIFGINGLADYVLFGIQTRDLPVIQATILVVGVIVVVVNLVVDLLYAALNPRIRVG